MAIFKKFRELCAHQEAKRRRHRRLHAEYEYALRMLIEKYGYREEGEQPEEYKKLLQRYKAANIEYDVWDRESERLGREIDEFARAERGWRRRSRHGCYNELR